MPEVDTPRSPNTSRALRILRSSGISSDACLRFGEPCVSLEHAGMSLIVSLFGAQILEWSTHECNNRLWNTDEKLHAAGSPIRGGIPLCWPWFGPVHAPFRGPSHGLGRRRHWELVSAEQQEDSVALHFRLEIADENWRLRADYSIHAGNVLALQLQTTNLGDVPSPVTPAFHPYFAVDDITHTSLRFASAVKPLDRLTGKLRAETDLMTLTSDELEIEIAPWRDMSLGGTEHSLKIESDDATHGVVWNPGPAKTANISDLHANAFTQFVCIEPARLEGDTEIPAGGTSSLSMTLSAKRD